MNNILTKYVFDRMGVPTSRKFLDLAAYKNKIISSNVANVSTPGYKAGSIDFKSEFARMTKQTEHLSGSLTNDNHIPLGRHEERTPEVHRDPVPNGEINSVDIDREMANMAKNELLFTVGARMLQKKFAGLRKAITSR